MSDTPAHPHITKEVAVANGRKPDYRVFISRKSEGSDKAFYTDVGAAWEVSNDGISIKLNALPTDGSLVLFPNRDEEHR